MKNIIGGILLEVYDNKVTFACTTFPVRIVQFQIHTRLQKLIFFPEGTSACKIEALIVTDDDANNNFLVFPCWIQKEFAKRGRW